MLIFSVPGHPKGYTRTTQRGCRFDEKYRAYQDYKDFVVECFLESFPDWEFPVSGNKKPLTSTKTKRVRLEVFIHFENLRHSDPSNVVKGIEDALFCCDKFVSGCWDFDYDKEFPRVEVKICSPS